MIGFAVKALLDRQLLGVVDVFLDVTQRDRRTLGQLRGKLGCDLDHVRVGYAAGHHADRGRFLAAQNRRQQVEFARLGAADQLGEIVGAAVIAGQPDLGKRGGDLGALTDDAQVAGQRQRQARTRRGAFDRRDHRRVHFVKNARGFHAAAQVDLPFLEARRLAVRIGHATDVATDAEGAAGALQQHRTNPGIIRGALRRLQQPQRELGTHRVLPFGPVHGDGEKSVLQVLQNDVRHGFLRSELLLDCCLAELDPNNGATSSRREMEIPDRMALSRICIRRLPNRRTGLV